MKIYNYYVGYRSPDTAKVIGDYLVVSYRYKGVSYRVTLPYSEEIVGDNCMVTAELFGNDVTQDPHVPYIRSLQDLTLSSIDDQPIPSSVYC